MSEAKTKDKADAGPKKAKAEKVEPASKADDKAAKTTDTASAEKTKAAPKSASQSSISHFSSVSTPAYKQGWESIFGGAKVGQKSALNSNNSELFPEMLTIDDEDIDVELRNALYKAFQKKARKQGISLSKVKKLVDFEYSLDCNLREK